MLIWQPAYKEERADSQLACRYVGFALTTQWEGQSREKLQVIGFDMGGTSTDVSRYAGSYEHVFESTTAGAILHIVSCSSPCTCLLRHAILGALASAGHWL